MIVALLTTNQKDLLIGQRYDEDSLFHPVQDANMNWVISTQEIEQNIYPEFEWIKDLPLIEFISE